MATTELASTGTLGFPVVDFNRFRVSNEWLGDLDGDCRPEVAVGAHTQGVPFDRGAVYVFRLDAAVNHPDRFARIVVANSGLPLGQGGSEFMKMWASMMANAEGFPFEQMLSTGMVYELTPEEFAAYRAPFPDPSYEAGICIFPSLIAVQPDNPGRNDAYRTRSQASSDQIQAFSRRKGAQ